ncbi:MAG: hypothetical protein WA691_08920 [Thermoplasmata archaeon]
MREPLPGGATFRAEPTDVIGLVPASEIDAAVATLIVSAVVVAVYVYVGSRILRRETSDTARLASYQFALWWVGLGAALAVGRFELALALVNALPYALALTFTLVNLVIEAVYLWGLVGYLIFVYSGKYHLPLITALYGAFYVISIYLVFVQMPYGVTLASGNPSILYSAVESGSTSLALQLVVLLPEFFGACVYLSLLRRTPDRAARFRISLLAASILFWVVVHAFVPSSSIEWILAKSVLEVIPAVLSLIALLPPEWVRRRLLVADTSKSKEFRGPAPIRE